VNTLYLQLRSNDVFLKKITTTHYLQDDDTHCLYIGWSTIIVELHGPAGFHVAACNTAKGGDPESQRIT
jgi:hypothetical protein